MKRVVLEIPKSNQEITYRWLVENGACKEGLIWFVETFGKTIPWKVFNEHFKDHTGQIHINGELHFDPSWRDWVKCRLKPDEDINNLIHIDECANHKIYMTATPSGIWRLYSVNDGEYYDWINISSNRLETARYISKDNFKDFLRKTINDSFPVYQFDDWKEALKWINEKN